LRRCPRADAGAEIPRCPQRGCTPRPGPDRPAGLWAHAGRLRGAARAAGPARDLAGGQCGRLGAGRSAAWRGRRRQRRNPHRCGRLARQTGQAPRMTSAPLPPAVPRSLFVAGTDTGVGKTWVATRLLAALTAVGHRAVGMKPVAAGAEWTSHGLRNEDALDLAAAGNVRLPYEWTNPVCLERATSPHLAAREAESMIDLAAIQSAYASIRSKADIVIVEGAGGWLAPIADPPRAGETGPTMQDVVVV